MREDGFADVTEVFRHNILNLLQSNVLQSDPILELDEEPVKTFKKVDYN